MMDARVGATRLRRLERPSLTTHTVPYQFLRHFPAFPFPSPTPQTPPFLFRSPSPFSPSPSPSLLRLRLYLVLPSVTSLVISSLFMDVLHPPLSQPRRRSVDVGGLSLALGSQGLGQGWVGWDESEIDTEEQQLLCVISPLSSTAVPRLICASSVLQNFLATCTIIPTLSSMPTNNRMSN